MTGNIFSRLPRDAQGRFLFTLTDKTVQAINPLDVVDVIHDPVVLVKGSSRHVAQQEIVALTTEDHHVYFLDVDWWKTIDQANAI